MKRCPKCNRVFRDELLNFCRLDGTKLENTADTLEELPTLPLPVMTTSGRLEVFKNRLETVKNAS